MRKPSVYLTGVTEGMREADTATISAFLSENQCAASRPHAIHASIDKAATLACLALAWGMTHE